MRYYQQGDRTVWPPIIRDRTVWKELDKNFFKTKDGEFSFEPPERYYYIAPHGVIVSMLHGKPHLMKISWANGYPKILFSYKGSIKNCLLHRLVCYHFRGGYAEDETKDQVDHIDGNTYNKHVYNLEWVTNSENIKRSFVTKPYSERKPNENHIPFEWALDWKSHDYTRHPKFPEYAACGETGAVVKEKPNGEWKQISFSTTASGNHYEMKIYKKEKTNETVKVHRFVYECLSGENLEEGEFVDHKEGKTFDNRFSELRKSNAKENAKNKKMPSNNTSGYTGIRQFRGKWQVRIASSKMHICDTLEEAKELRRKQLEISHRNYQRKCSDDN